MLTFELIPISRHKRENYSYKIKPGKGWEGKAREERPQMTFEMTLNSV